MSILYQLAQSLQQLITKRAKGVGIVQQRGGQRLTYRHSVWKQGVPV